MVINFASISTLLTGTGYFTGYINSSDDGYGSGKNMLLLGYGTDYLDVYGSDYTAGSGFTAGFRKFLLLISTPSFQYTISLFF